MDALITNLLKYEKKGGAEHSLDHCTEQLQK